MWRNGKQIVNRYTSYETARVAHDCMAIVQLHVNGAQATLVTMDKCVIDGLANAVTIMLRQEWSE